MDIPSRRHRSRSALARQLGTLGRLPRLRVTRTSDRSIVLPTLFLVSHAGGTHVDIGIACSGQCSGLPHAELLRPGESWYGLPYEVWRAHMGRSVDIPALQWQLWNTNTKVANTMSKNSVSTILVGIFMVLALGFLIYFTWPEPLGMRDASVQLVSVLALLVPAGLAAFWVRENHRRWYGLVEYLIGAIIGAAAAAPFLTGQGLEYLQLEHLRSTRTLALLGSIYVMVRGLDNYEKSLIGEPLAKWRAKWWERPRPFFSSAKEK